MNEKIAIVANGGGISSCYLIGVLKYLSQIDSSFKPNIIIGSSGSTAIFSFYVSRQSNSMELALKHLISNKKIINPWRFWKIIDIRSLVDDILIKKGKLNLKNIFASEIQFYIAVTNRKSGLVKYYTNKDIHFFLPALKASMSIPFLSNNTELINGLPFIDSRASVSIENNIAQAIKLGATKIIAIDSTTASWVNDILYHIWLFLKGKEFRINHNRIYKSKKWDIPENVKCIRLKPKNARELSLINNSKEVIEQLISQGYKDALESDILGESTRNA